MFKFSGMRCQPLRRALCAWSNNEYPRKII
ncbi:acetyltransferase [Vibrio cholerae]|nr:acetyltransferase [Vibrio cholerae]TQP30154.1 acetyltransferase [Vibrio cholerae]